MNFKFSESTKEDLLKRKVKIPESELKLKDKIIEQLEYQVKNGKLPPVDNYITPNHVFEFLQRQAEKMHMVDLEIENIELKEKLIVKVV